MVCSDLSCSSFIVSIQFEKVVAESRLWSLTTSWLSSLARLPGGFPDGVASGIRSSRGLVSIWAVGDMRGEVEELVVVVLSVLVVTVVAAAALCVVVVQESHCSVAVTGQWPLEWEDLLTPS